MAICIEAGVDRGDRKARHLGDVVLQLDRSGLGQGLGVGEAVIAAGTFWMFSLRLVAVTTISCTSVKQPAAGSVLGLGDAGGGHAGEQQSGEG